MLSVWSLFLQLVNSLVSLFVFIRMFLSVILHFAMHINTAYKLANILLALNNIDKDYVNGFDDVTELDEGNLKVEKIKYYLQ